MKSSNLKIILSFTVYFLSIFFSVKVVAQSKVDCAKATTQPEINACSQNEYILADKELNEIYNKISAKLDVQKKTALMLSQRKWIAFRDEYCKIYGLIYNGGSMAPSAIWRCKTQTTRARIVELKSLFDQVDL